MKRLLRNLWSDLILLPASIRLHYAEKRKWKQFDKELAEINQLIDQQLQQSK